MSRLRRSLIAVVSAALVLVIVLGVGGYLLFTRPHGERPVKADAIVVLGGDWDGRVQYGMRLAQEGYADTVVLSNSWGDFSGINKACASAPANITVICFRPDPFTTRGEAMFTQRLAKQRHWKHIIVISWNFHMVRARYIFGQCFDGTVTMIPVPRRYDYGLSQWAFTYAYQYGALVKAALLGCDRNS